MPKKEHNNSVQFIDWYGGDKAIARAAWVSTQTDIETKTDEEIGNLIDLKLWNNPSGKPHKTPFERGLFEVVITVEQASHIHTIKHRLAQANGESARYMELKEDKFYLPYDWDVQIEQFVEPESGITYVEGQTWNDILEYQSKVQNNLYHESLKQLSPVLGRKRAKESARFFKTMNSQIRLSVMMNMSCFHNFYTLRSDEAAQHEIQYVANDMLDCLKRIEGNPFKHTLKAFGF